MLGATEMKTHPASIKNKVRKRPAWGRNHMIMDAEKPH